jgi:hypothetical protein
LIDRQYQSYPNPKKAITVSFVRSNYRKKNQTKSNISQLLFLNPLKTETDPDPENQIQLMKARRQLSDMPKKFD